MGQRDPHARFDSGPRRPRENSEVLEKLENSKTQKLDAARADNERTFVRVFALGVLEKLAKTAKTRENWA